MRNFNINGATIQDVRFSGVNVNEVRFNGTQVWGRIIEPNPGTSPPPPTTSNLLNPTQVQLNAMTVGQTARFAYNGTNVVGTGSAVQRTIPANWRLRMQCWGGGSPNRNGTFISGGYAQGERLFPATVTTIFFTVGERGYNHIPNLIPAGLFAGNPQTSFLTPRAFGGGGRTWVHSSQGMACGQGAGATDIRVLVNGLNNRILVGGGSGSTSETAQITFFGGGATGGGPRPGTQIGTPSTTDAEPGGFGLGGGYNVAQGGRRNSGGGGWFGGGNGNNDNAASGGSGYALTSTSHRPAGYFTQWSQWVLTNAWTSPGGLSNSNGVIMITRLA